MRDLNNQRVCFSIVSHSQAVMIRDLLYDLAQLPKHNFEVLITLNVPEDESPYFDFELPLRLIRNTIPKGFGANHNAAFAKTECNFFAVVNPDIRIKSFDFQELLVPFENLKVAALAPMVLSNQGEIEDNARHFPTLLRFAKRLLRLQRGLDYPSIDYPYSVDWLAGMFVVFRSDAYRRIEGFDDRRFFMYLEDADICRRLHRNDLEVLVNPSVQVIHNAQRASRRNLKHMRWHAVSALRYLTGL